MDSKYITAIKELEERAGVPYSDIFDFHAAEKAALFDRFYNFCQTNLSHHSLQANIQPAFIFYNPEQAVNARAKTQNGYFLIEIFAGLIVHLYDFFYNYNNSFESDQYLNATYVALLPTDTPPGYLMYQVATQFTYYHERAHLIQHSPFLSQSLEENYKHSKNTFFDFSRHLMEFDADIDAAHYICFHIIEYWKKQPLEKQNLSTINNLIALAVSSIFTFFVFLEGKRTPLYFAEKLHPHAIIRISYVINAIIAVAEENLAGIGLNGREILHEAFNISERMALTNNRPNPIARYRDALAVDYSKIISYSELLVNESEKVPFLVRNRVQQNV